MTIQIYSKNVVVVAAPILMHFKYILNKNIIFFSYKMTSQKKKLIFPFEKGNFICSVATENIKATDSNRKMTSFEISTI